MKALFRIALLATAPLLLPAFVTAQAPQRSPKAMTMQTIGITEVSVEYSRPAVRGREIWGALVPYGQLWRAGANLNTRVSFSDAVRIAGKDLAAGTYGLQMIPTEKNWTVIFSKDNQNWGSSGYDPANDALRIETTPRKAPFCEWMSFGFDELGEEKGTLFLHWEELVVPIPITVDTAALMLGKLQAEIERAPSPKAHLEAASLCLAKSMQLDQGLEWIDAALAERESFEAVAVRAGLLGLLGEAEESASTLEVAFAIGKPDEVAAMGSRLQSQGHQDMAVTFLERATRDAPTLWWAWRSLGDAHKARGRRDEAVSAYQKAIDLAPGDNQVRVIEASLIEAEKL